MAGVEVQLRQVHRDRPGAAPEGENAVEGAQRVGGGEPGGEHLPQKRDRRLPLLGGAQPGAHPVAQKDVVPALRPRKGKAPVAVGKLLAAAAGGGLGAKPGSRPLPPAGQIVGEPSQKIPQKLILLHHRRPVLRLPGAVGLQEF